jgi:hypothetical protein
VLGLAAPVVLGLAGLVLGALVPLVLGAPASHALVLAVLDITVA